jgi:hypothetical protein
MQFPEILYRLGEIDKVKVQIEIVDLVAYQATTSANLTKDVCRAGAGTGAAAAYLIPKGYIGVLLCASVKYNAGAAQNLIYGSCTISYPGIAGTAMKDFFYTGTGAAAGYVVNQMSQPMIVGEDCTMKVLGAFNAGANANSLSWYGQMMVIPKGMVLF